MALALVVGVAGLLVATLERVAAERRASVVGYACSIPPAAEPMDGAQSAIFAALEHGLLRVEPPAHGPPPSVTWVSESGDLRPLGLGASLPQGRHQLFITSPRRLGGLPGHALLVPVQVVVEPGRITRLRPSCR